MARYDDLDTKSIAASTVISAIVLVVLILAGRAMAYAWQSYSEEQRTANSKYTSSDEAIAAQKAILQTSGKVQDPPAEEGGEPVTRIVVPVDKAQKLIIKELSTQPKT